MDGRKYCFKMSERMSELGEGCLLKRLDTNVIYSTVNELSLFIQSKQSVSVNQRFFYLSNQNHTVNNSVSK